MVSASRVVCDSAPGGDPQGARTLSVTPFAQMLQAYGAWGCTAALAFVCAKLYRDLQAERAARLGDAQAALEDAKKNAEAWSAVIDELGSIRTALERRKG